jgi:hypothetical protein
MSQLDGAERRGRPSIDLLEGIMLATMRDPIAVRAYDPHK